MGKPKTSGRKSAGESSTKQVDSKSRGIEKAKDRITRERKEKSYRETEPTDSENEEVPDADPDAEVDSAVESDSDFGLSGNSSGSEYGKKKGKSAKKASPVKGRRPAKRPSTSSPKKGGRGRGRALKAPPKSSRNGKKKARGDSSEEEASLSDQSDGAYPPPAKVAKTKPKASVSPKRGRGAKKAAAGSDDESSAPPRRGGRQRTEIKYKVEDSDEESDPNDKIIPGASSAKKPAATGSGRGRGRKPAAAKAPPVKKVTHSDDEDKSGSDEDDKPLSSKNNKAPASNSDDGSDSDEKTASTSKKPMARKAAAAARAKNAESSEGEDDDESYGKSKKVAAPARKAAAKKPVKADSESGEEDSDMDEAPRRKGPPGRKPTAAATATLKSKESDDSESEEKSPPPKKEGLFDELKSKTQAESDSDSALSEDKMKKDAEKKENSVDKNDAEKSRNRNGDGEKEDDLVSVSSKDGSEGSNGKAKVLKNKTATDFASIDFTSDKKTASGEEWNFKISCWNVSGIKSWVSKSGLEYLKRESPDIMCLQEVKCTEKTAPPEVKAIEGYPHSFWNYSANAGQSGVAILSKTEPKNVSNGIPIKDDDSDEDRKYKELFNKEGRLIVAEYENFILFNAYVPNSGRGTTDASHPKPYPGRIINGERLGWDKVFREYIKAKDAVKPVIVVGDLNVAHESIDLANPTTNTSTAGFTKEERESFTNLLEETQLFDSFRSLYPKQTGAYSYWSYMRDARTKNVGWRLDYFLLSEKLRGSLCENLMRSEVYGSDHCPIVLFARI